MDVDVEAPPAAVLAERAYLATLLRQGGFGGGEVLGAEDFYWPAHRAVYRAIVGVAADGGEVSIVTVADRLERDGLVAAAGGYAQLADLCATGADAPWAQASHARIIREKARLRAIVRLATEVAQTAGRGDPEGQLGQALAMLSDAVYGHWERHPEALTAEELDARFLAYVTSFDQARVPTGVMPLDARIGGIGAGQVLTILARTGVGKSAIAQNVVDEFLNRRLPGAAVVGSAEMPSEEVFLRQLQIHGEKREGDVIGAYRAGTPELVGRGEFLAAARRRLLVIPEPHLTLEAFEGMVRAQERRGRIETPRLVVLDYLGLFDAGRAKASDVERYGEIAKGAKVLAKRLGVALVLIAQASRSAKGGGEEVSMVDARNSGEIEESADFLVGVWRPALSADTGRFPGLRERLRRVMFWRLLKARRSGLDEFITSFDGRTLRVQTATEDETQAAAEWRERCRRA